MSLRDQLVAKGFASKKKAQKVNRELKQSRKKKQGKRRRKRVVEAEAQSAEAQARAEALAARRARQLQRHEAKEQMEQALRVRNLLIGNRVQAKGPQPFWHLALDRRTVLRLQVSLKAAEQLRAGQLAIVGLDQGRRTDYWMVPESTATTLWELAPHLVVFRVTPDGHAGDPEFQFLRRTWDSDLRPHRQRSPPAPTHRPADAR